VARKEKNKMPGSIIPFEDIPSRDLRLSTKPHLSSSCGTTLGIRTKKKKKKKKKICLFYLYVYIVTLFRHTRRGHQIPLQMVVSHHVVAGN
jgi:hypothetical protein